MRCLTNWSYRAVVRVLSVRSRWRTQVRPRTLSRLASWPTRNGSRLSWTAVGVDNSFHSVAFKWREIPCTGVRNAAAAQARASAK